MLVCVLGGTGYVGSRLIGELIKGDNLVFCVYRKNSKSTKDFLNNNKVKYIVSDYLILKDLFIKNKFDCIINTACTYMKGTRIDDVVESNLIFPLRLLSLAVENTSDLDVGIVVVRSISGVRTPPIVSIPRVSGVTSRRRTSFTSPCKTPP